MVERVFLGSGTHLLPSLASWLLEQHADGDVLDCSQHLVVLPTARSRKQLECLLLEQAEGRQLVPPDLTTPAGLLDRYLIRTMAHADSLTLQLAWLCAIKKAPPAVLKSVTGHDTPLSARESTALANRLHRLLHDLGGGGYTPVEVHSLGTKAGMPLDNSRWEGLESLWQDVQSILASCNRKDPDTARREALDAESIHIDDIESISIVSADPSHLIIRLLDHLNARGICIRSIIHGQLDELQDDFDEYGAVKLDNWEDRSIDLRNATVVTCDREDDQAAAILDRLADHSQDDGPLKAENFTVAIPDDNAVHMLVHALHRNGVPVPEVLSRPADDGRIGRLIKILADYLEENSARHLGDLVRHPDVEAWLIGQGITSPVAGWDAIWTRYIPRSLDELPEGSKAHQECHQLLSPLLAAIQPFHGDAIPAHEWCMPFMDFLGGIITFSGKELESHDEQALRRIQASMEGQLDLLESPPIRATEFLKLLQQELKSISTWQTSGNGIGVVGWLDTHLDVAPELFITGLTEGILPANDSMDTLLPEQLRELLGIESQRRRFARDAWLLHAILTSGRHVTLVSPRRSLLGSPLAPSRLLLRTSGEALATRIQELISKPAQSSSLTDWFTAEAAESSFLDNPIPGGDPVIDHVSVTDFRRFLEDPAAFLLQRDQRVRARTVDILESLSAADFGSMIHVVLERWGIEEVSRSHRTEDPEHIDHALQSILENYALERFGPHPSPGIRIQIAIASHRLHAVARVQADRAMQGWKVELIEKSFGSRNAPLFPDVDGLPLHGKIDRVDLHAELGYQAIDYKTSSKVEGPRKTHMSRSRWKDLQLPLYRVLLRGVGITVSPNGLGYFHVPPDPDLCSLSFADWNEDDLHKAEEEAGRVVQIITSGKLIEEVEATL